MLPPRSQNPSYTPDMTYITCQNVLEKQFQVALKSGAVIRASTVIWLSINGYALGWLGDSTIPTPQKVLYITEPSFNFLVRPGNA